ncbi:MAG: flotillin-like protein FloA [Candidatus Riflebacteria bacterium]|nr:flotillin-like protein FloA [Candidatus Riflebacteria bacterium]
MEVVLVESLIPLIAFGVIILFFVLSYYVPVGLWISAIASGVSVGLGDLIGMRFRRVSPREIIDPAIMAKKAGINVGLSDLESHYLAKGNVFKVVSALIAAQKAGINLSYKQATAIDLAGRDVYDAVKLCVKPKVIQTPLVAAMAKNGIQVKAIARITVKVDINKLVGGATEETILARVGEGIVTTIGSAASHEEILENPDKISKTIQNKGLDANTAFEILSIDIADVDIGENIGAKLQIDQSEADMKIAQAKAAERRAMAEAREQEMKAYEQEMRAKLVEAEAAVPQAISDALKDGNMGILDYYTLKNISSDTEMRHSFSNMADPTKKIDMHK